MCVCVCLCVYVCLWFESTPVDSYNLSSHYHSLELKDSDRLGVLMTHWESGISKIIREAKTFNTRMSLHGLITVIISTTNHEVPHKNSLKLFF